MAKKDVDRMQQQLQAACEELQQQLLTEQGRLDVAEREAAEADHQKRMESARRGGYILAVLRGGSRVKEVAERRQELPYLVWSVQVRLTELKRDVATAELPEAEAAMEPAREALRVFEVEKMAEVPAEHDRLRAEHERACRRAGALEDQRREAERRLERLLAGGPEI